jgi:hypothetical protein
MNNPSSHEQTRISHINNLMRELHDSNNEIYEGLIDRDFESIKSVIDEQITRLTGLRTSLDDGI